MNSVHQKSPFIFFFIFLGVSFSVLGYLYFRNPQISHTDTLWIVASLKVTTNTGACAPRFPCYETYFLHDDGNILYNDDSKGKLSPSVARNTINKAFGVYKSNICTPFYVGEETQTYELIIDGSRYTFGGNKGCREMQDIIHALEKAY